MKAVCRCREPSWSARDRTTRRCREPALAGEPVSFSGGGLLARCLQHETDHIYGTVFGDRLNSKTRKRLQKAHAKVAGDFPDDWPA